MPRAVSLNSRTAPTRARLGSAIKRRRADSNRCMEVLQTSPLATWVRRHAGRGPHTRNGGSLPVSTRAAGRDRARGRSAERLLGRLLALLLFLLAFLERLHATLGLATLAHIALERSTAGHVVTSRSAWDRMPRGPRRIRGA